MKREKIILAFIIMPFFLFSLNLKLFKSKRSQEAHFSALTHNLISQERLSSSPRNHSVSEESLPDSNPFLPRKAAESPPTDHPEKKYGKFHDENFIPSRLNRGRERNRSPLYEKFERLNNETLSHHTRTEGYVPDQILIKFKPSFSEEMREATIAAYQCRKLKRIPRLNIYQLQIPEQVSLEEMLFLLRQNPDVEYAEPNYLRRITVTPNDTFFRYQYSLYNSGQDVGPPGSPQGKQRADIRAKEGWEETTGTEEIIIAVLDTGIDFEHPDIDDKVLPDGYDFVNNDPDPTDDHGHGTHVAGIAAAETDNSEGIAGVAWNCKILPIKILDDTGWGDVDWEIQGIIWAIEQGADVINLSLGGDMPSQAEREAIMDAYENDVVVVASAGNDGGAILYPAAYDDYVLAVAATINNDDRATFQNTALLPSPWESNYGPEIDVAAPGYEIISLVPTWYPELIWGDFTLPPYGISSGTSMSAPHAAGLAALIRSIKPELTAEDIMNVIRYTAKDVNSASYDGRDDFIGYGRIDMEIALVPRKITSSKKND